MEIGHKYTINLDDIKPLEFKEVYFTVRNKNGDDVLVTKEQLAEMDRGNRKERRARKNKPLLSTNIVFDLK